jgi:hypothetical protein
MFPVTSLPSPHNREAAKSRSTPFHVSRLPFHDQLSDSVFCTIAKQPRVGVPHFTFHVCRFTTSFWIQRFCTIAKQAKSRSTPFHVSRLPFHYQLLDSVFCTIAKQPRVGVPHFTFHVCRFTTSLHQLCPTAARS